MFKWSLILIGSTVFCVTLFGWVLPALFSSKTDEGPLLGAGILIILLVVVVSIIDWVIKKFFKEKK